MTDEQFTVLLAAANTIVFEQRAVLAEQREQTEQLRQLRVDLAEQRSAGDVRLALVLRATFSALGNKPFTAAELVDLATAPLSTRLALRHAVECITGDAKAKSKSLGKFLSAQEGNSAEGLRLVRVRGNVFRIESSESRGADHWPHFERTDR